MPDIRKWLASYRCLGAVFMAYGLFASAQAADCGNPNISMIDLTMCADQQLKRADNDLNAAYATLMKKIEDPDRQRLRDAERTWIAFRDSECLYRIGGENQGGTLWPMLELRCKARLTEARGEELRKEIRCPSFDLSCTQD